MQNIDKKVSRIIKAARKAKLDTNFYFESTLRRYLKQVKLMNELQEKIDEHGIMVTKKNIKGDESLCVNPAVTEYNKTASAANNTVNTLIKIMDTLGISSVLDLEIEEDEL